MSTREETFENCEIKIEDEKRLYINQKEITFEHNEAQSKWSSRYLPYTQYDSLDALAKAIITDTAEFK